MATLDFLTPYVANQDNSSNTNAQGQQGWLVIGDSHARGTAHVFNSTSADKGAEADYDASAYYYAAGAVSEITSSDLPEAVYGSWWPSFANLYYKLSSRKAVIINKAVGGAEFYPNGDTNNWYTTGANYAPAVTDANACLAAIGTTKLRGIFIALGLNDARGAQSLSDIQAAIISLISRLHADFPGVPIYMVNIEIGDGSFESRITSIQGYIEDLTTTFANVYVVAREADFVQYFDPADLLHFTHEGNEEIAHAIMSNMKTNNLIVNRPLVRTYTAEAQAVFALMPTTPIDWEKNLINDCVQYLQRKGYWASMSSFYFMRLDNEANSLQDWLRSKDINKGSTTLWDEDIGLITDGTVNGAFGTNFLPFTDEVNANINKANCYFFVWVEENLTSGLDAVVMGATGATSTHSIVIRQKADNSLEWSTNTGVLSTTTGPIESRGGYAAKKISGSAQNLFTKHEMITASGGSASTVEYPENEIYIGCHNNNGSLQQPLEGSFTSFYVAAGTTTVNNDNIYKKIRSMILSLKYNLYE